MFESLMFGKTMDGADNIIADDIQASTSELTDITANKITAVTIISDSVQGTSLNVSDVRTLTLEATMITSASALLTQLTAPTLTATSITTNNLSSTTASIPTLTSTTATIPILTSTSITTNQLSSTTASVPTLTSSSVTTDQLSSTTASIPILTATSITTNNLSSTTATIPTLTTTTASIPTLNATSITTSSLTTTDGTSSLVLSQNDFSLLQSSSSSSGISLQTTGSGTIEFILNGTRRLVLSETRATFYGDLYLTGNIYSTPSYTNYTPFLIANGGTLGTVNYSLQTGIYYQTGPLLVYQLQLAGSTTSSTVTALSVSSPPISSLTDLPYTSFNIITTLDQPILATAANQLISFTNPDLTTPTPLSSGSFSIQVTGLYLTQLPSTYTPTFVVDSGSFQYSRQKGSYLKLSAATIVFIDLAATFSGVSTTSLSLSLPTTPSHPSIASVVSDQNPESFLTSSSLINSITHTPTTITGSGSLSRQVTLLYLDSTALPFTPKIKANEGTWVETNPTWQAFYTTFQNFVVCTMTYSSQVVASATNLSLTGLPLSLNNNVSTELITSTNIDTPLSLQAIPSSSSMNFWNQVLNQ